MMPKLVIALSAVLILPCLAAAEDVPFAKEPALVHAGGKQTISFAVTRPTDVEVAILDAAGKVVRHLAAGVLGGENPPPAPLRPGLAQSIEWDGRDDCGKPVADLAGLSVRVRAGMGVSLEKIVGGDPYAFYSKEMGQGDHAAWRITGLEAKPDGNVYVMGNVNNYGPPAIRRYDALGNYQRTVFPPPAGKPIEEVKGWGLYLRADGTYSPRYGELGSPVLTTTPIDWDRGGCAGLLPSAENDRLTLRAGCQLMTLGTDGTISPNPGVRSPGPLVATTAMADPERNVWKRTWTLTGPFFVCPAPDGKHFYLSGVYAGRMQRLDPTGGSMPTGFWRDGQVWKVDAATRKASVFFALDEDKVISDMAARGSSPIGDGTVNPYAALHGVAVDSDNHVLICDRQNRRIVVLDKDGKFIREIPVAYPDAIALDPKSKAVYVTTRFGSFHKHGEMKLLKFNDWTKDSEPSTTVPLGEIGMYRQQSFLAVCRTKGETLVWVAYTTLPVRIYRDTGAALELAKDFYEAGPQRALDLQHMVVDAATENVYISDGFGSCFRINDWKNPQFARCMMDEKTPLMALNLAIDARSRRLYGHFDRRPVARYKMDGPFFTPDPLGEGGGNALTPRINNHWDIGLGFGDRGLAVAPDGSIATLGAILVNDVRQDDYFGPLNFFKADPAKAPWTPLLFKDFGEKVRSGGIRFDLQGNLYAGKCDGEPKNPPAGFEKDALFNSSIGRIYKYAPTGALASGDLFPTAPAGAAKVYDIHYGVISPSFSRTARFGVDGFGRIYYPTSLLPRVSVIDNEGNNLLSFGTYGNRDSAGGLAGDLVPTKDIPLAWPSSVDATDDYIYVTDIVNVRLLRIKKTYAIEKSVPFKAL